LLIQERNKCFWYHKMILTSKQRWAYTQKIVGPEFLVLFVL